MNNNNDSISSNNINNNFQLVSSGYVNIKIGTDLVGTEDSNSSSGVTTEELVYHHHQQQQQLNLDLSIGLPSQQPNKVSSSSSMNQEHNKVKQEPHVLYQWYNGNNNVTTSQGVCLCYGLGFQSNQACSCKAMGGTATTTTKVTATTATDNDLYRFYRPMSF